MTGLGLKLSLGSVLSYDGNEKLIESPRQQILEVA